MRALLGIVDDFSQATRALTRHPKFFLFAALILSLGIGMTTALFSLMYGVLLKPLPFPEQDRLVVAWKGDFKDPAYIAELSCPEFRDWQARSHVRSNWNAALSPRTSSLSSASGRFWAGHLRPLMTIPPQLRWSSCTIRSGRIGFIQTPLSLARPSL